MAASREGLRPAAAPAQAVGRDAELASVDAFLNAGGAKPLALVVEGEAGMGKTTIVRAALARADLAGARVFLARPAAGELELPYAGLGDLLATARPGALAELAGPQRGAIEAALGRAGSGAAVDGHALSRGVLELLRLEGAGGDLLLAVDDVQWLDRPTVTALAFALRRVGPLPVRVLVAVRTGEGSAPELPFGLADWEHVSRLAVGPLSATELGILLRQRLGEQLTRPRLEALRRESGGNPMFALELARQAPSAKGHFPTLPMALEERLRTLDSDARGALTVAAAAMRPSADLLLRAGVGREELRSALATGILGVDGERLSFAHPLLGTAAYALLLPDERRRIHARLAAASEDVVERGHHLSRSAVGPDDAAARALADAAEAAAALGDHAAAAGFLVRAAALSLDPSGEPAQSLELQAAKELEWAGDVGAAAMLARSLVERLPPGIARAEARLRHESCAVGAGMSYEEGLVELGLGLEDARADDAMSAELHIAMAEVLMGLWRLEEAVVHLRAAIDRAELAGAPAVEVVALGYLGFADCILGRGTDAARRAFESWDGSMDTVWAYSPRMVLAEACLYSTEFEESERLYQEELAMAEERGLEAFEVVARAHLADTQMRAGNWSTALANARLAVEHGREAADAQIVTAATFSLAMVEALLGDHDSARQRSTEALAAAEATRDVWHTVNHRSVLGLVALGEDDPQAAVEALEPAWSLLVERGVGNLSIFPVAPVLAEALVATGRVDDAAGIVEALRASPVGDRPWCRAMASRCAALVASARGDHEAARLLIEAALEAHAELPEPFEHARTLHLSGRVSRRARSWGAARTSLVDALERFDTLGAARWAEKAAADLARLPGRRPADKQTLTTREREIAELVAAGLANKEIAARLYLSPRTVEASLSKAYAKLGIRSRTELAGRLDRPDSV